ncbi:hypothetical protein MKX03_011954, partial [Papaver bracteatum]
YEHKDEKNISSAHQGQSISNMKELLDGDLVPITNYSQPLGPIYVLRRGGGRGGHRGRRRGRGRRYRGRGGTSSSCEIGSAHNNSNHTCESIARLSAGTKPNFDCSLHLELLSS